MSVDYRTLCVDLVEALNECTWPDGRKTQQLVNRAKALLAEPEPDQPSQRQILMLAEQHFPDSGYRTEEVAFAKDVLKLWGRR